LLVDNRNIKKRTYVLSNTGFNFGNGVNTILSKLLSTNFKLH